MRQGRILPPSALLRYKPAAQESPETSIPSTSGSYGHSFAGIDGIVDLSDSVVRARQVEAKNFDRLRIIGGEIHAANGTEKTILRLKEGIREAFVEGLLINASGFEADAINAGGRRASGEITETFPRVVIQSTRVEDLIGSFLGEHSDCYQPQNPVGALLIDKFTGKNLGYQGFFLAGEFPIKEVRMRRVNLERAPGNDAYLLWLVNKETGEGSDHPVYLEDDVWIAPREGKALSESVWPPKGTNDTKGNPIGAVEHEEAGTGRKYVEFNDPNIHGRAWSGKPPGGDFVTTAACGLGYVSSGYA